MHIYFIQFYFYDNKNSIRSVGDNIIHKCIIGAINVFMGHLYEKKVSSFHNTKFIIEPKWIRVVWI